jgi:hypothetical protein
MSHSVAFIISDLHTSTCLMVQETTMLIVVTIDAKVFPITPVRRIVVMVVVLVMNCEKM